MANKYYEIIKEPTMLVDGENHEVKEYNMNLSEFLKTFYMNKLYIFEPSITTNKINGIVL